MFLFPSLNLFISNQGKIDLSFIFNFPSLSICNARKNMAKNIVSPGELIKKEAT